MDSSRANRLRHLMNTEGWGDLIAMLDEQIEEPLAELRAIATSSRCEQATGKTGIRLGNRAQGLIDFKESILEANRVTK